MTQKEAKTMVKSTSCSCQTQETEEPCTFMKRMLQNTGIERTKPINNCVADENKQVLLENYDMKKVTAIRENNLEKLRQILNDGESFNACNRNGETLLHLACRRGDSEIVKFLVEEAKVDIEVQDDLGRSVLHDICWRPYPDFALMDLIMLKVSPAFLLAEDRRGHTCFDYCRKEDWSKWIEFLRTRSGLIQRRALLYSRICYDLED